MQIKLLSTDAELDGELIDTEKFTSHVFWNVNLS